MPCSRVIGSRRLQQRLVWVRPTGTSTFPLQVPIKRVYRNNETESLIHDALAVCAHFVAIRATPLRRRCFKTGVKS
jgi:hypothetical protein